MQIQECLLYMLLEFGSETREYAWKHPNIRQCARTYVEMVEAKLLAKYCGILQTFST